MTLIIPSGACCAQYSPFLVPATPNDDRLPQPPVLHLLSATDVDYPAKGVLCKVLRRFISAAPNDAHLLQISIFHFLLKVLTIRSGTAVHGFARSTTV